MTSSVFAAADDDGGAAVDHGVPDPPRAIVARIVGGKDLAGNERRSRSTAMAKSDDDGCCERATWP